jgi:hypothetical protein
MNPSTSSGALKLFGTELAKPEPRLLKAGALTALFDNGALRRVSHDGTEVLRGIAYLPRDKNWGTYAPTITDLQVTQGRSGFVITYRAAFADQEQSLMAEARIEATTGGTLTFTVTAIPRADFITNRTGFVILHPLQGVVGKPVDVLHTDGATEKAKFPAQISPGQPIFEIRALTHKVRPGVTATVLMEGNKFEMEDHRNWMDASYKTYVCSLLDPWPYRLPKGQPFTQSVTLTVTSKAGKTVATKTASASSVTLGAPSGKLPAIGTAIAMADAGTALAQIDLIAAARPAYLVCQIDGRLPGQAEAAAAFQQISAGTGIPVTLEVILPAQAPAAREMSDIAAALKSAGLAPQTVVITQAHDLKSFQPGATRPWGPTYEEMAAVARVTFPGTRVGGGMMSFFTELNRKPPPPGLFDFITHSVCPIVHAADDLSVMETLESLPWIFKSTRALIGKTPYHLGPSSIACRDNPYGATSFPNPEMARICLTENDPRQRGLFAAAWMLGLLSFAAQGRLTAVALGSATGPRGVILGGPSVTKAHCPVPMAEVVPAYHVLAGLSPFSGQRRLAVDNSSPSTIACLAHLSASGPIVWIANLTPVPQRVQLKGPGKDMVLHRIDSETFEASQGPGFLPSDGEPYGKRSSLELAPFAVTRLATAERK